MQAIFRARPHAAKDEVAMTEKQLSTQGVVMETIDELQAFDEYWRTIVNSWEKEPTETQKRWMYDYTKRAFHAGWRGHAKL